MVEYRFYRVNEVRMFVLKKNLHISVKGITRLLSRTINNFLSLIFQTTVYVYITFDTVIFVLF